MAMTLVRRLTRDGDIVLGCKSVHVLVSVCTGNGIWEAGARIPVACVVTPYVYSTPN